MRNSTRIILGLPPKGCAPILLLILLLLGACRITNAQAYISGSFSYYNGGGTFSQQGMATLEVGGYVHEAVTLGVAAGRTSFSNGKTYVEFRPSVTLLSNKNISVSASIGAGYVFDTPENFLTEYCGNLSYSITSNWSMSVFAGGYNFNGKSSASKFTFVGTGLTYTFKKK